MRSKNLSKAVKDGFIDRKQKGRIDFFVNLETEEFTAVPRNIEHSDFAETLPKGKYIPIQYRIENGVVKEILVGASSNEAENGIRHLHAELRKANDCAWQFCDLPVELKRNKIFYTYASKQRQTGQQPYDS